MKSLIQNNNNNNHQHTTNTQPTTNHQPPITKTRRPTTTTTQPQNDNHKTTTTKQQNNNNKPFGSSVSSCPGFSRVAAMEIPPQAYCGWQACSAEARRRPCGDAAHGVFPRVLRHRGGYSERRCLKPWESLKCQHPRRGVTRPSAHTRRA